MECIVKTFVMKKEAVKHDWYVIDAQDKVLGRLAARVAIMLQGKNKPTYTPYVDTGDFVIVTNAGKIQITGTKSIKKIYYHHTGWRHGLKARPYSKLSAAKPTEIIELAVKRMMPKTRLGRAMFKKLKVYAGPGHRHAAQKPKAVGI